MSRRMIGAIAAAIALTLPWTTSALANDVEGYATLVTVTISGVAILGASFLLTWGAETAEEDVPRAFAIAVLAVLAVAPEYAVDALYAWNAGVFAGTPAGVEAGNLAVANMTGANRILIGIGWAGIALFTILRGTAAADPAVTRRSGLLADTITLDRTIGLEIVFLAAATLWAFLVPINGGIDLLDTIVLVSIYVAYILVVLRGDRETGDEQVGVPAYLQSFGQPYRALAVLGLFIYSGVIIFTAVEPFAHGLEGLGTQLGIPSFFMIQWIAPLASESPELIVVVLLVLKARSTAGFNALISSKLNQWTLLIGTLAVVYSLGLGQYGALPFDQKQAAEIWITAAQSFFALTLIVDFRISVREAVTLLTLFIAQVGIEFLIIQDLIAVALTKIQLLYLFTAVYLVLGAALLALRRRAVIDILNRARDVIAGAIASSPDHSRAD